MKLIDICAAAVIAVILGGIVLYLIRARKRGVRCVGCPDGHTCSGNCQGCSHALLNSKDPSSRDPA